MPIAVFFYLLFDFRYSEELAKNSSVFEVLKKFPLEIHFVPWNTLAIKKIIHFFE